MKKLSFKEAIGETLAHDIIEIKPNKFKGIAFKKGHVIKAEDEEKFKKIGKQHLYVIEENEEDLIHEDDIAILLFNLMNNGDFFESEVSFGKISFVARKDGFFKVHENNVINLNMLGELSIATLKNNTYVKNGDIVMSARLVPLYTTKNKVDKIKEYCIEKEFIKIESVKKNKIGVVTTGSEVYNGLIKDGFKEILENKLTYFNLKIYKQIISDDDANMICEAILELENNGCDLILVTGGMSVDPDDVTKQGIEKSGFEILVHGTPIIPGSMNLIAYKGDKTILGLPGGMLFEEKTAFDILIPKVLLNEKYNLKEVMSLSVGGLLI